MDEIPDDVMQMIKSMQRQRASRGSSGLETMRNSGSCACCSATARRQKSATSSSGDGESAAGQRAVTCVPFLGAPLARAADGRAPCDRATHRCGMGVRAESGWIP